MASREECLDQLGQILVDERAHPVVRLSVQGAGHGAGEQDVRPAPITDSLGDEPHHTVLLKTLVHGFGGERLRAGLDACEVGNQEFHDILL